MKLRINPWFVTSALVSLGLWVVFFWTVLELVR
jgi:hypothetical protein